MSRMSREDRMLFYSLLPFASIVIAIFITLFISLVENSIPVLIREGINFIVSSEWRAVEQDPKSEFYGILSPLIGTLITSIIALVIALPLSISLALFMLEYAPNSIRFVLSNLIEVMTGLPTVIYGLWGLFILAPLLRDYVMYPLYRYLWLIPLFSAEPVTPTTLFTASVVLAIMIVPFMTRLVVEAYRAIPVKYKEAALALGFTKLEYCKTMLSLARPAIIAAALLGWGRAAGETVAVCMTIGNSFSLTLSLFKPGYTISSLIANQFPNAEFYHYMYSALYGAAFILLLIGLVVNSIAMILLVRWRELIHGDR